MVVGVIDNVTSRLTQSVRDFFSNANVAAGVIGWAWKSRTSAIRSARSLCNRCERGTQAAFTRGAESRGECMAESIPAGDGIPPRWPK